MLNQDFFMDYVYEIHIEIYTINEHNVKIGYNVWSGYLENLLDGCYMVGFTEDGILNGYVLHGEWYDEKPWKIKNLEAAILELENFNEEQLLELPKTMIDEIIYLNTNCLGRDNMNFGLDDKIKEILVDIKFRERYAELSKKYRQVNLDESMEIYENEEIARIFKELGYNAKFFRNEIFFQIKEKEENIEFIFNISVKHGLCELIWSMKKEGELVNLGPWSGISRQLHIENEVIKNPIFTNYEELKEILEIAFNIYEDFKEEAIRNIDEIKSRGF